MSPICVVWLMLVRYEERIVPHPEPTFIEVEWSEVKRNHLSTLLVPLIGWAIMIFVCTTTVYLMTKR